MVESRGRWAWSAIGIGAGIAWLSRIGAVGLFGSLPIGLIGALLLGAGFSPLLWPGDRRVTEIGALVGLVGAILALPLAFAVGPLWALVLWASALAAATASGARALALEPPRSGVPVPSATLPLAAKVAVDEVILGLELGQRGGFVLDGDLDRAIEELAQCRDLFERQGFLEKPDTYHIRPPDLVDPEIRTRRIAGHAVEVLRFASGYAPRKGEPGRERWLGYASCRDAYASSSSWRRSSG